MNTAVREETYYKNNQEYNIHCLDRRLKSADENTETHYHEYIEILYGIDCDMSVWINDRTFNLQDGTMIIINSNEIHSLKCNRNKNHYFVIKFMPFILENTRDFDNVLKYMQVSSVNFNKVHFIDKNELEGCPIQNIMKNILKEWRNEKFAFKMSIQGYILILYSELIRIWQEKGMLVNSNNYTPGERMVYQAMEYCRDNYNSINESSISNHFSVSCSYFSRIFKRVAGIGFSEYINSIKIDEARKMLLTTDKPIVDIAYELNFSSSSHLSYVFKKRTRMSPLSYRKKHKIN